MTKLQPRAHLRLGSLAIPKQLRHKVRQEAWLQGTRKEVRVKNYWASEMLQMDPNTRVKKGTENKVWYLPPPPNRRRVGTLKRRRHSEMERSVLQGSGMLSSAKWGGAGCRPTGTLTHLAHGSDAGVLDTWSPFCCVSQGCPSSLGLEPHVLLCFPSTSALPFVKEMGVASHNNPPPPPTQAIPNTTSPHLQVAGQPIHGSLLY